MIFEKEADFEEAVITVLKQHGWNDSGGVLRYPTEADLIKNWAEIIFNNNSGIDRLNGQQLTETEMAQILEQIESLRTPLALNGFINGKTISVKRDNPADPTHLGKEVSLKIFDRQEIAAGHTRYQIAQQPIYAAKNKIIQDRRGDICLLINGMPVIHLELKRSGVDVSHAAYQIEKYSHEGVFTGIFRLVQIFVAMNPDEALYFANPGPDKFSEKFYFHWEDFNNELICGGNNPGTDEWKRFVSDFLSIPMAHQLIGFYTVADSTDGILKVMRSYQYRAASSIVDTVRKTKWDVPLPPGHFGRPGGYIWHTTGSGKTMTSFKSAQLIADTNDADKVVFLMDRIELGTQSLSEYRGFADDKDDVQGTENTAELKAKLADSNPSNRLIVTSIQKMSNIKPGNGSITAAEVEKLAKKRIVFILDECHRSTFGDMLQDIRHSFPNALYFGFTGTPILDENKKKGSTTAMVFGKCLHRYSIADGIRDKNVLGFDTYMVTTYRDKDLREAVALEKAKAQTRQEAISDPSKSVIFYHYMDASKVPMASTDDEEHGHVRGIEDYLNRAQYLPHTPHHYKVVSDIKEQFPILSRDNKFHAMLATSSIPEAIAYYHEFKEQAPELKVTALFDPSIDNTSGATVKEDALVELIGDYNATYNQEFRIATWGSMKRDISNRLAHKAPYVNIDSNRNERIDILIVVDQMLTGFDSKWLNTLYLDKVIDYESIIQAFSRTNRVFNGQDKPFGIVRYYRKPHTMYKNIEAAVKLYSGDKPLDLFVQKLPENVAAMDARLREIKEVFKAAGVPNLERLPDGVEARKKFAKEFIELNEFLEAAKVQGFTWDQDIYVINDEGHTALIVMPEIDRRTYQILVQRYKELLSGGDNPQGGGVAYKLEGYITEIDTGHIDTEYMNANFIKWLKCLNEGNEELEAARRELHRSFATLSQEEQRLAEIFLHDVESGEASVEEGKTLRDYITMYGSRNKDRQVKRLIDALGVDRSLLEKMMSLDLNDKNINEFGRFDDLKDGVDKKKAKEFFEMKTGKSMPMFKVNIEADKLLKKFILSGGFDIDE